jgi:hypothetical protein
MRIGNNPNKEIQQEHSEFVHQIIIPIYIPNEEGYFTDALKILKLCLNSLFNTVHKKTYITVVNNGSCDKVRKYLDELFFEKKINELIQTDNIGKINAVFKGLSGINIELVTISDSDVMFLPDWQIKTVEVFQKIPKAGVVGIVPQFRMYKYNSGNVIFDNFFKKQLKFIPIKNKNGMIHFYESIGWGKEYNQDYLKFGLGLDYHDFKCFVGTGHFVATYKKDVFQEINTFIGGKKVAGIGEAYIDNKALEKDYWRLTTYDNYAYHMGNTHENWMDNFSEKSNVNDFSSFNFPTRKKINRITYFFKNKMIKKLVSIKWTSKLFLKWTKLPKEMIDNF